jgi:putative flippase GtrA
MSTENPAKAGLVGKLLALRHSKEMERFLKFAVVGTIGAAIDSFTFNFLRVQPWLDPISIRLLTGAVVNREVIAGTAAFLLAVISNFIWNRYWTYPDSRSKSLISQLITFFGINLVGLFIRALILQYASQPLGTLASSLVPTLSAKALATIGANAAWAIAVILVMFWNFFVNRYWTYNDVS